ncbi:hypothetical protein ACFW04_012050 [Cataglyphis niger]
MATVSFIQINLHHSKGARLGCIRCIAVCGRVFKSPTQPNSRAAIAVKGLQAQLLPEFCSRDVAAIMVDLCRSNTVYFLHEEGDSLPPGPVVKLVEYCQAKGLPLVRYYTVWDSTKINDRGKRLLKYLNVLKLKVLNFILCSRNLIPKIVEWQASSKLANVRPETIYRKNPKRTDWDSFQEDLSTGLYHVQMALMGSLEKNCPPRAVRSNKRVSWWGPGLQRARKTGRSLDWELYRSAQKTYKNSVIPAKRKSWKRFCKSVEEVPEAFWLCRILARNPVSGERCLVHLQETNFPGFRRKPVVDLDARADQRVAHADFESLPCFGIHLQGMEPGEFRAISLTSFFLKTLEKLVETYLRDVVLGRHPLHGNQHAYRMSFFNKRRSTLWSPKLREISWREATQWGPFWI